MSVYPLPLAVVPATWQDNGSCLYPIANRDVAILAGKKFLLDGPVGNDYLTINGTSLELFLAGIKRQVITTEGFVTFGTSAAKLQVGSGNSAIYLYGNLVPGANTTFGNKVDFVCSTGDGAGSSGVYLQQLTGTLNNGANLNRLHGSNSDLTMNSGATCSRMYGNSININLLAGSVIGTGEVRGQSIYLTPAGTSGAGGIKGIDIGIVPAAGCSIGGTIYGHSAYISPAATAATLGITGYRFSSTLNSGASTTGNVIIYDGNLTCARTISGAVFANNQNMTYNSGAAVSGAVYASNQSMTFNSGAAVSGAVYASYHTMNLNSGASISGVFYGNRLGSTIGSGATLTGQYFGRYHSAAFNSGATISNQIYDSYSNLIISCPVASAIYGSNEDINISSVCGSTVTAGLGRIKFTTGATVANAIGKYGRISLAGTSSCLGYARATVGEINLSDTSTTISGTGNVGSVYLSAGTDATSYLTGVEGSLWLDKTTNPGNPSGPVAGLYGFYGTPGIALNSAFTLGGTACRAAAVGYVWDSANTIPHAAFLAFTSDGNLDGVAIPAAFKAVDCRTAGGRGFNYGLDLLKEAGLNNGINLADIRGHAGNTIKNLVAGTWEADAAIKSNGLTLNLVTKFFADSGYLATVADYTLQGDAVGGAIVLNLPSAVGISGRLYNFVKIDATANAVTVTPNGAETISGAASKILAAQWATVTIQSNGTNWIVL